MRETVGPGGGGTMYSPVISPHDLSLMFVACDMGGLYRSRDGGQHWLMMDGRQVMASSQRTPHPIAFHPNPKHRSTVFAYGEPRGLRISRNDGDSWEKVSIGEWKITAIGLDANGRLFVGTTEGARYHDPPWSGQSWNDCRTVTGGEVVVFVFLGKPGTDDALYFLATRGKVLRSLDQGATWQDASTNLPAIALPAEQPPRSERWINSLAGATNPTLHPSAVLYVVLPSVDDGGFKGGVYRSDTLGMSWQSAMGTGIDTKTEDGLAQYEHLGLSPNDPNLVYVTVSGKGDKWPQHSGVYRSQDGGNSWAHVFYRLQDLAEEPSPQQPKDPNVDVGWLDWARKGFGGPPLALAVRQRTPGDPKAATAVWTNLGMLYVTTNGGERWTAGYTEPALANAPGAPWRSVGLEVTTAWHYYVAPNPPSDHDVRYICYTDIGFLHSLDGGVGWRYDSDYDDASGEWRSNFYELAMDPDPTRAGHMWAAAASQHDIPYNKELRRPTGKGGVVFSADYGKTWSSRSTGLPGLPVVSVVLDPTSPIDRRHLWASVFGSGVYFSNNEGLTWTKRSDGPGLPESSPTNLHTYRLHRHESGTLFCAVTGKRAASGENLRLSGLFRSTDEGLQWKCITGGLSSDPSDPPHLRDVHLYHVMDYAVHPRTPKTIYLCTASVPEFDGAVYKTENGGETWIVALRLHQEQEDFFQAFAATFDLDDPNHKTVYIGTTTHGTWVTRDGGDSWEEVMAIPFMSTHRLAFDPHQPGVRYVTTFGGGVWSLTDI